MGNFLSGANARLILDGSAMAAACFFTSGVQPVNPDAAPLGRMRPVMPAAGHPLSRSTRTNGYTTNRTDVTGGPA